MAKKFYTIDDLLQFCKKNNFNYFSAKEYGAPLVLQSFETFEVGESNEHNGLLPVKLAACHIGVNRNGSAISEENMNKYKASFKGRPILGSIIQLDSGEYDFHSHDMEIVNNGEELEVNYIEQPIGVISQLDEPFLEYDKDKDKTYLMVSGHIFEDYSKASEILKAKKRCKCSVEIAVEEMSYNAKENYLSIDSFYFTGVTVLGSEPDGTEILEGMEGSNISIDAFSKNDSNVFKTEEGYQKLLNTLEKLDTTLSAFQINKKMEGVEEEMNHFEELLEQYGFTEDELDFDHASMTDEELDAAFEDFKCKKKHCDDQTDVDGEGAAEPVATEDPDAAEPEEEKKYSINANWTMHVECELSHDDVRQGLYGLYYAVENYDIWIVEVFDNYFIGQDYKECKFFKQGYSKTDDSVAFEGDPVEVFGEYLTQAEKDVLAALKSDYAELKAFKENYDAAEIKAQKDAIFANEAYNDVRESDEFKALVADADKYSVEDLQDKCDLVFAASIKKTKFSAKPEEKHNLQVNFNAKQSKKQTAYGGLFDE